MNQLKLVWELEKYNSLIDGYKINLSKLESSNHLKNMNKRIDELDSNIKHTRGKILENNKMASKLERLLKDYDYKKTKIEEDLYSGKITDLKQLEQLTIDKEETFKLIDELESKILKLIDDNEDLEKNYSTLKDNYMELKDDAKITEKQFIELIEELRDKIYNSKQEKDKILPKLDDKILKRYNLTREKKGKGIVPINGEICGGCNMRIPTYLIADIKNQTEIIYCESCGRILYFIDEQVTEPNK